MITLTGGNVQTLSGLAVPGGKLQLALNADATVISGGGQVMAGIPISFSFDSTANLSGVCKVWSNAELSPTTQYLVNFYDADGARLNQNPLIWSFAQGSGSSVDIGTVTSLNPGGIGYALAIVSTPPGNQTITTGNLTLTTGSFVETANAVTGTGGLVRATSPTLVTPNIGVATATSLTAPTLTIPTNSNTLPGTITNDTTGGLNLTNNAGNTWQLNNSGTWVGPPGKVLSLGGATSGATLIQPTAIASGTLTLPAATDTLVARTTTDTLTNKALGGTGATTPDTTCNRLKANRGSALVAGDFSISAAWGSTASIASVTGTDAAGTITILTGGTGIAANPSITLTFHDGTWTNPPTVIACRGDVQTAGHVAVVTVTATQVVFIVNTTPNSGQNYPVSFVCIGR